MNRNIQKNIKSYDDTIEQYFDYTVNQIKGPITQRAEFIKLIPPNAKILDLACGPGRDSKFFYDNGYNVIGIDLSKKAIKKAREFCPNVNFFIKDITTLDMKHNSFDAVWFEAGLLCFEKKDSSRIIQTRKLNKFDKLII